MTYVIAEPCRGVEDKACVEVCPVDCIYDLKKDPNGQNLPDDPDMLIIHPVECIDCGACEPVCPVSAIFPEEEVPEEWKDYTALNKTLAEDKDRLFVPRK